MKTIVYLCTCTMVMLIPFIYAESGSRDLKISYEFITTFQGAELMPVTMGKSESAFYTNFPGVTGYFTLNGRPKENVFLRYTEEPTRMLHSAEGCYRASGFELEFTDNVRLRVEELSDKSVQWSQFRIQEKEEPFLIRQCIVSLSSNLTYSDVPAWYWQTTFSSDDLGPWLAVTWKLPESDRHHSQEQEDTLWLERTKSR